MLSRRSRYLLYKFWALLGLVRWYNVILMAIALYLSGIFMFNSGVSPKFILSDPKLHLCVIALAMFIASGFIINAFYDLEKDMINRPGLTFFDRHISRKFSLNCYVLFNAIAAILSLIVSWEVFVINLIFTVVLWLYSHKMRKMSYIGEFGASMLSVAPFFSLAVYYSDVTIKMVEFVALIFVFIFSREIVKKLIAMRGDIILGDKSIPITIGEGRARSLMVILAMVSVAQLAFFIRFIHEGYVDLMFYAMAVVLGGVILLLITGPRHKWVNRLYKLLIIMMIGAIPFI